jgi:hypothetical protein
MGTTLKFLSENTVRKCTFGNVDAESLDAFAEATGIYVPPVEKEAWVEI